MPPLHGRAKKIFREPTARELEEMGGGREVKAKRSRDNRAKREAAGMSQPIEDSDDDDFLTVSPKDLKSLLSNKKPKSGISSRSAPKNIKEESEEVPKNIPEKKTGRKFVRSKPVRRSPSAAAAAAAADTGDRYDADEIDGSEAPIEKKDKNRIPRKDAQMDMLRRAKKHRDRSNDDNDD